MKKITLITVMLLVFALCSVAQAAQVIRLAADDPVDKDSYAYAPWYYLANAIDTATGGKMKLEVHGGATLGNGKSIVEQCQAGIIEFSESVEGLLSYWYPSIQVLTIPYLFKSHDIAYAVLDGPFGQEMREDFRKKTGMRIISWCENGGFRNFMTSNKPLKSPDDLKGLKIRTMEIPAHMALVKALGANPIPVAWTELYTALQTGVADGCENSIPTLLLGKLDEVQKFMVLDGHVYSMQFTFCNDAWFQKQDPALQKAILSAGRVMDIINRGICRVGEMKGFEYLKNKGWTIYQPNAAEQKQFRELTQGPVIEWLKSQKNIDQTWITKLMAAVDAAETKLGMK